MAITTTILARTVWGNRVVVFGKSVLSGTATSGDVATGLRRVIAFDGHENKDAQKGFAVEEDFPLSKGDVTVHIETTDGTFYWTAIGDTY